MPKSKYRPRVYNLAECNIQELFDILQSRCSTNKDVNIDKLIREIKRKSIRHPQGSEGWKELRMLSIGGSNRSSLETKDKRNPYSGPLDVILTKAGCNPFVGNIATMFGNVMEWVAEELTEKIFNTKIEEVHMVIDGNLSYSPDAIIAVAIYPITSGKYGRILIVGEFKSPFSRIPGKKVPTSYISQMKAGVKIFPTDISFFMDNCIRICPSTAMDMSLTISDKIHRSTRNQQKLMEEGNPPLAWGCIVVTSKNKFILEKQSKLEIQLFGKKKNSSLPGICDYGGELNQVLLEELFILNQKKKVTMKHVPLVINWNEMYKKYPSLKYFGKVNSKGKLSNQVGRNTHSLNKAFIEYKISMGIEKIVKTELLKGNKLRGIICYKLLKSTMIFDLQDKKSAETYLKHSTAMAPEVLAASRYAALDKSINIDNSEELNKVYLCDLIDSKQSEFPLLMKEIQKHRTNDFSTTNITVFGGKTIIVEDVNNADDDELNEMFSCLSTTAATTTTTTATTTTTDTATAPATPSYTVKKRWKAYSSSKKAKTSSYTTNDEEVDEIMSLLTK
mgnify:CR=1 FL=1